ncbi:MAG TPA: lysylphosphatidylglycerol synthase domain-containing protein [Blastocatellia bacterium]|nr:lysylphosphatidylglycerol synthase domain-containing protein [Blastocatellia bacterium]
MKSRLLSIISLIVGAVLFIYLLRQSGTAEVLARVRALGASFGLILAISALRQLARTYAWLRCLSDDARRVGFWAVLRARLAGDALADLTAAGPMLGEPIKIAHLKGRLSLTELASSLAVENLAYAVSAGLMVLAGALTLLTVFTVGDSVRTASLTALLLVMIMLLSVAATLKQRWRIVSGLVAALFAFFHRRYEKLSRVQELESYVFDFYARRRTDFVIVAACELTFHLAGIIEIYTTIFLLGFPVTWLTAFILEAVNRIINIVFAFVPAMVGVDEAGTGWLTNTLGLGLTAGVTLALVRKARMLVWIGLGLGLMLRHRGR